LFLPFLPWLAVFAQRTALCLPAGPLSLTLGPSPSALVYFSDLVWFFCPGQPRSAVLLPYLLSSWDYRHAWPFLVVSHYFNCNSIMTYGVEHLLICLLAIK
jgi:hypothetical protein